MYSSVAQLAVGAEGTEEIKINVKRLLLLFSPPASLLPPPSATAGL